MSHITSTRIDHQGLRASDLHPVDQLEDALRARLGKDIPITYIPSAGNGAITLDNELAGNNISQDVHVTSDVTTTPASLYMYIFRPSDRGRIASLIRHHFRVERFTQSHTYDELEEVGSHTTQSVADAYFINFYHAPGTEGPHPPWQGLVKVEVISESPWNVKFNPYLGERRYLDIRSYWQSRADDIDDMYFAQTRGSLEDINNVLKTQLTRRSDSCQWHAQKIPQSAKILEMFLKAHNCYSPKDLISMVQYHLVSVHESTYSNVEREYGVDCLPLGIFIIDRLLLEESETGIQDWGIGFADDSIHKAQNESEAYLYKLKILFSTMAWLGELFDLKCFGQIFDAVLNVKIQRERVKKLFVWLGMPKQAFLSGGLPLREPEATDASNLNRLWHWLHQLNYRQVKFALAISRSGLIRERKDAIGYISDLSMKYLSMPTGTSTSRDQPEIVYQIAGY